MTNDSLIEKTALLPCPFCGGKAEYNEGRRGDDSVWIYIACADCEAMAPYPTESSEAWNTRADLRPSEILDNELREKIIAVCHSHNRQLLSDETMVYGLVGNIINAIRPYLRTTEPVRKPRHIHCKYINSKHPLKMS